MKYLLLFVIFFSTELYAQRDSEVGRREIIVLFTEKISCLEARSFLKEWPVDFTCSLKNSNKQMAYTVIYYGKVPLVELVEKISRLSGVELATVKKRIALPGLKKDSSEP